MWREYAPSSDAVAIETSVHALERALGDDFLSVPVRYIDRGRELLPDLTHDPLEPFFFKGHDFEWERELRFVGGMVIGTRLGTPRRIKVLPSQAPLRFIVAPSAPASSPRRQRSSSARAAASKSSLRSRCSRR